jgi:type I restriction enzyme M protein
MTRFAAQESLANAPGACSSTALMIFSQTTGWRPVLCATVLTTSCLFMSMPSWVYVLSLLFIKYISDKYADIPYAPITAPKGASFADMVALKGKPDIGDQINKKIVAPLAEANQHLSQADFPDFNDAVKLGDGKEKVDRLTDLISIFQSPVLDFSKNRAEGDEILGDAYEYLMRHFATESGKSKGQFYTPAEVSRVIAKITGIHGAKTGADTTVYDPTCGSGSLLLKVADESGSAVTL